MMTISSHIAVAVCAFLGGMLLHSAYYRYASGYPLRLLLRRMVYAATEWFFEHIVKIRPNRFLEYISSVGLLALLGGKIAIVIAGYWREYAAATGLIAGCAAVAGCWQLYAVSLRDQSKRIFATQSALVAWSIIIAVLIAQLVATDERTTARMIIEFVVPLSLVFWLCAFVQMWVLLRYQMYPERPREIEFFYAVLNKIEQRTQDVFKLPSELKRSINQDVVEVSQEFGLRK